MSLFRFRNSHGTLSLASKSFFKEKEPVKKEYEPVFNQMNCEYTVEQRSES